MIAASTSASGRKEMTSGARSRNAIPRSYEENDLEIFIAGRDTYYEFEINAFNTVYEVFWIWKEILRAGSDTRGGRIRPSAQSNPWRSMASAATCIRGGERWGILDGIPGLRIAVHVEGVVNCGTKTDRGWTAEVAFPWSGLELLADGRSLPPREGDVLAHRLFPLRRSSDRMASARPLLRLNLESPRTLPDSSAQRHESIFHS